MKKKSASRSAFFNLRVLIGLFMVLTGVFLALAGLGTFSALTASIAQAQQKKAPIKIINIPGLPPGFDCATIHERGIDKMEGLKWGLLMINCGVGQGGSPSATNAFSRLVQKLLPLPLAPLAYGAADVNLVTTTPDTFPNTTQSETFTTANPDNPDQVVVAFNDSRGANFNNFSGASMSTTAAPRSPESPTPAVKARLPTPLATPLFCTTNQPAPGSPSGSTATGAVHWADTSPPIRWTRPVGVIFAFTTTAATTGSPAGLITIPPLPTSETCMFRGMTLIWATRMSLFPAPLITVPLGAAKSRSALRVPSFVT